MAVVWRMCDLRLVEVEGPSPLLEVVPNRARLFLAPQHVSDAPVTDDVAEAAREIAAKAILRCISSGAN